MIFREVITKSEREIAERALDILKRHKHILFEFEDFTHHPPMPASIMVKDLQTNAMYCYYINSILFEEERMGNESKTIPFDDIVALRIAKLIFENYKAAKQKELNDAIDNTLNSTQNKTISSIKSGAFTYDIGVCGKSLTTTVSEVEELKDKVKELTDLNDVLTQKVNCLEAVLTSKGLL